MTDRDTHEYWRQFCRDNGRYIDAICDLFTEHHLTPERGQQICLFVAGMSAGIQQKPIAGKQGDEWVEPAARGWQLGASQN